MSTFLSLRGAPATKQSSHFDKLKVLSLPKDWIATARGAGLAMTERKDY